MVPPPVSPTLPAMQRFLIGLALTLLLIISIAIGIAVARWPQWRHLVFQTFSVTCNPCLDLDPQRRVSIAQATG